jgi:hypothetical protein
MLQENYHLGVFFESLRTDERINIFSGLHRQLVTDIRELMIHMVLHTDMSIAISWFQFVCNQVLGMPCRNHRSCLNSY